MIYTLLILLGFFLFGYATGHTNGYSKGYLEAKYDKAEGK